MGLLLGGGFLLLTRCCGVFDIGLLAVMLGIVLLISGILAGTLAVGLLATM